MLPPPLSDQNGFSMNAIARRIAENKGSWLRRLDGRWERVFPGPVHVEIAEHIGLWRVTLTSKDKAEPIWESAELEECFEIAGHAATSALEAAKWEARELPRASFDIGDGLSLEIWKSAGCTGGHAHVYDRDRRRVGGYSFKRTEWPADYVLGQPTINGSVGLNEDIRGKGICRKLYDTVEAMFGLPIVPHGRNLVPGGLTAMSTRFWEKREAERQVVGASDPAVAKRREDVMRATAYLEAEAYSDLSLDFAVAAAKAMSWKVRGAVFVPEDGTPETLPWQAWCVTPEGRAFSSKGFFDERPLLDQFKRSDNDAVADFDPLELASQLDDFKGSGIFLFTRDLDETERSARLVLERHGILSAEAAIQFDSSQKDARP